MPDAMPDSMPDRTAEGLADLTLDELRLALAPAIADEAIFDGWGDTALAAAATRAGVDPDVAKLAFDGGAMQMIESWIDAIDAAMIVELPREKLGEILLRRAAVFGVDFVTKVDRDRVDGTTATATAI